MRRFLVYLLSLIFLQSVNASCPWGSPNDVTVFCTDENPLGITYDAMKSTTAFASVGECSDRTSDLIEHTYFTLEEAMFIDSVKNIRNAGLCNFYCYRDNYRDSVEALYKKANVYKSCYRATGCLGKIAYPSWFAFQIEEGGELAIKIEHVDGNDIDFACWGPFQGNTKVENRGRTHLPMGREKRENKDWL